MKAKIGASLMVPFITTDDEGGTDRNFAKLSFSGPVDRRRIKREVRKWVYTHLDGRRIDKWTMTNLMRQVNWY